MQYQTHHFFNTHMKQNAKVTHQLPLVTGGNNLHRKIQQVASDQRKSSHSSEDGQTKDSYTVSIFTGNTGLRATIYQPTISTRFLLRW